MVTFKVYSAEFDKFIADAVKQVGDLRPAFIQIAREFYKANKAIFALKGPGQYADFSGPKIAQTWKNPGQPSRRVRDGNLTAYQYAKQKATGLAKGYPLLKFTGTLEKSITEDNDSNSVKVITPTSLTIGTSVKYGKHHQYGTSKMPMRPFLFLDPTTTRYAGSPELSRRQEAWTKVINNYVRRTLGIKTEGTTK